MTDANSILAALPLFIARGGWAPEDLQNTMTLDQDGFRALMGSIFQDAAATSRTNKEAHHLTSAVRRHALMFACDLVDYLDESLAEPEAGSEPVTVYSDPEKARAFWLKTTLNRRLLEEDVLGRGLSFGNRWDLLEEATNSATLQEVLLSPAVSLRRSLDELKVMQMDPATAADVGYEAAYLKHMMGDFAGARAEHLSWAERQAGLGDEYTATVFRLQAVQVGVDALAAGVKTDFVPADMLLVHEAAIPTLRTAHLAGNKRATMWLQNTMPTHLRRLGTLDASIADQANALLPRFEAALQPEVAAAGLV